MSSLSSRRSYCCCCCCNYTEILSASWTFIVTQQLRHCSATITARHANNNLNFPWVCRGGRRLGDFIAVYKYIRTGCRLAILAGCPTRSLVLMSSSSHFYYYRREKYCVPVIAVQEMYAIIILPLQRSILGGDGSELHSVILFLMQESHCYLGCETGSRLFVMKWIHVCLIRISEYNYWQTNVR